MHAPQGQRSGCCGAESGGKNNTMNLWDIQTGNVIRTFLGLTSDVSSVCFSPDGKTALSVGGEMKLWDIQTGNILRSFSGHVAWLNSVCFSSDGKMALSGSDDNDIKLWNVDLVKLADEARITQAKQVEEARKKIISGEIKVTDLMAK